MRLHIDLVDDETESYEAGLELEGAALEERATDESACASAEEDKMTRTRDPRFSESGRTPPYLSPKIQAFIFYQFFALNSRLSPGNIRVRFGFGLEFHAE